MPHRTVFHPASLLAAALCLGSCSNGKHTGELREAAHANMDKVHAAADYDLAAQQFETGNMDLALQAIDNSLKLAPDAPKGHLLRGRILLELGPADPALTAFDAGIVQRPDDPELHYYRAIALERMDEENQALAGYLEANRLDPNQAEYLTAALEALVDLGRVDEAAALIGKQPFEVRNHPGVKQSIGHIAQIEGNPAAAIEAFTQAVVLAPEDPVLREDLARALISERRFADAETHLAWLQPTDHYQRRRDLQHMHAACLLELNQPVQARQILLDITRAEGGDGDYEAWLRLVDCALILDDDALLHQAAARMVGMAPDRHEGHLALAMWQRRSGDLEGALKTLDNAERFAHGDVTPAQLRTLVQRDLTRKTSG